MTKKNESSDVEESTPYYDVSSQNEDVAEEFGETAINSEATNFSEELYDISPESEIGENQETGQSQYSVRETDLAREFQAETNGSEETANLYRESFERESTNEATSSIENETIEEPEISDARPIEYENRFDREESAESDRERKEYAEEQSSYPVYPIEDFAPSDHNFSDVDDEDESQEFTDQEQNFAEPINETNYQEIEERQPSYFEDRENSLQIAEPEKSEVEESESAQDESRLEQYLDVEAETSEEEVRAKCRFESRNIGN